METLHTDPEMRILHVLTLNGRNGEYGGPVRVAREISTELEKRGFATHIFSGALSGSEPFTPNGLNESYVLVKPLSKRFSISTLWSFRLIKTLIGLIRNSDLVHIHFARDLIPFLTAIISIILRKPFVTQTHGMVIYDGRLSTRVLDIILTRRLMNKSFTNFVLSTKEQSDFIQLNTKPELKILPNGININFERKTVSKKAKTVVFCSRLEKRKGVNKFIELADCFKNSGIDFEIYGPDGGQLNFVYSEIKSRNLTEIVKYKGALQAHQVQEMLARSNLLILPSKDEPFPMVILEALAVGTPVVVMPSCGFAKELEKFDPLFVSRTEDVNGLRNVFQEQLNNDFQSKNSTEIINYCRDHFGIETVVDQLLQTYRKMVTKRGS